MPANPRPVFQVSCLTRVAERLYHGTLREALQLWWRNISRMRLAEELLAENAMQPMAAGGAAATTANTFVVCQPQKAMPMTAAAAAASAAIPTAASATDPHTTPQQRRAFATASLPSTAPLHHASPVVEDTLLMDATATVWPSPSPRQSEASQDFLDLLNGAAAAPAEKMATAPVFSTPADVVIDDVSVAREALLGMLGGAVMGAGTVPVRSSAGPAVAGVAATDAHMENGALPHDTPVSGAASTAGSSKSSVISDTLLLETLAG
eukprot:NODE_12351_length_1229_cov_7.925590.p1 GENE.NODE_12351_length_1229_cov_7.925590~~NODE_12351_length_1229_cov_7.925590.p1  ORF type:complete len:265 (+),score=43.10 NODE_12351_length_1229_cov_7.925590:182-976(+)